MDRFCSRLASRTPSVSSIVVIFGMLWLALPLSAQASPPTISAIGDQSTIEDTVTGAIAFTVDDAETVADSLIVTASSNNQTLIPNANITLGGSGASRTIDILPGTNQFGGPVTITLTVSDGVESTPTTFNITVTADNDAPTISTIGNQTTAEDTATGAIAFTIGDVETAADSLTVSATSDDQTLIPNANITLGGTDASRTISILPDLNQSGGSATITVTVTDGVTPTQTTFTVTVSADNDAPTISAIGNQLTTEDTNSKSGVAFSGSWSAVSMARQAHLLTCCLSCCIFPVPPPSAPSRASPASPGQVLSHSGRPRWPMSARRCFTSWPG